MDDYQPVEIKQNRGPMLEFEGRLLCATSFPVHAKGMTIDLELWETRGGSMVAASFSTPDNGEARTLGEARVIGPGPDEQARRFAAMDQFEWNDRARSMVRKQLKWKLSRTIA